MVTIIKHQYIHFIKANIHLFVQLYCPEVSFSTTQGECYQRLKELKV